MGDGITTRKRDSKMTSKKILLGGPGDGDHMRYLVRAKVPYYLEQSTGIVFRKDGVVGRVLSASPDYSSEDVFCPSNSPHTKYFGSQVAAAISVVYYDIQARDNNTYLAADNSIGHGKKNDENMTESETEALLSIVADCKHLSNRLHRLITKYKLVKSVEGQHSQRVFDNLCSIEEIYS